MNNKELNHNASDELNQPLTALAKKKISCGSKARLVDKLSTSALGS